VSHIIYIETLTQLNENMKGSLAVDFVLQIQSPGIDLLAYVGYILMKCR
jgi:hypothetical protein